MAAIAYPVGGPPVRRAKDPARRRRHSGRPQVDYLRVVDAPPAASADVSALLFDDPIFDDLAVDRLTVDRSAVDRHRPGSRLRTDPADGWRGGAGHVGNARARDLAERIDAIAEAAPRPSRSTHATVEHADRLAPTQAASVAPEGAADQLEVHAWPARPEALVRQRPHFLLRRLVAGCLVAGVFTATWFGADALGGSTTVSAVALKGATPVRGGYEYVIRPGDTLWSIASEVDPSGDPRQLVDQLSAQLGGAAPVPGDTVRLP